MTAIQHGNAIFSMMVSFHVEEEDLFNHQDKMPDVPPPDKLTAEELMKEPLLDQMPEFIKRYYELDRPIERTAPGRVQTLFRRKDSDGRINIWIRTAAKLPDDPALHQCALAYASESLLDLVMSRYGRTRFFFDGRVMAASLDHAMWFHRPFLDEWLLYSQDSPNARGGRGLARGLIFKPDGTLVASVAQEGSLREKRDDLVKPKT